MLAGAGCIAAPQRGGERGASASPAALTKAAQADLAAGKTAEALRGFELALERDPRQLAAIRGRIEAARRRGLLSELSAQALARTQLATQDGLGWYTLGLCRFAAGDQSGAQDALGRAVELAPGEADFHFRFGVLLFDAEKFAEAKAPLARAVELDPRSARYRVPLASCLDRLGDRRAAIAALREVARLSPSEDEAALAVKASRAITDPFRGLPPGARAELEQALGYLLKDAPALAVTPLEALLQKLPDLAAAHALLGLAALRMDEPGRAVTELKRAAELAPDAPQPHGYLAELYAAKDRPELAEAEYAAALERDPLDVGTLRKLGLLRLEREQNAAGALEPLRAAVTLAPGDDGTQLLLARAELSGSDQRSGRERLERLAEKRPDDAEVLLRLALALFDERTRASGAARGDLTQRVQELAEKVLTLQPENAAASRLLSALQQG